MSGKNVTTLTTDLLHLTLKSQPRVRELFWVTQHPLQVRRHTHGDLPLTSGGTHAWVIGSTLQGMAQTIGGNTVFVFREDHDLFDYQPTRLVMEKYNITDATMLSPEDFDEFATLYTTGEGNTNKMPLLVSEIERLAPSLRFLPRHLQHLVSHFEANEYTILCRIFLRHDLTDYEALVWLSRTPHQLKQRVLDEAGVDTSRMLHVTGGWYAVPTIEDAISLKFKMPKTEIYRTRE